jgi:hypothetical protein
MQALQERKRDKGVCNKGMEAGDRETVGTTGRKKKDFAPAQHTDGEAIGRLHG